MKLERERGVKCRREEERPYHLKGYVVSFGCIQKGFAAKNVGNNTRSGSLSSRKG